MSEARSGDLARTLGELAVAMHSQPSVDDTLKSIVGAVVHLIPEASWAGISVAEKRTIRPKFPADEVAEELDRLQTELGEGPAFDALLEKPTVHVPDLRAEARWPTFVAAAAERGVNCMMAFRLYVDSGSLGVLSVYGSLPQGFSPESVSTGAILAQHAAVAIAGATAEEQFEIALASRDIIAQAKGLLMQRDGLTGLQAFATLTKASQETNIKLVDVARWLVNEHEKKFGDPGRA